MTALDRAAVCELLLAAFEGNRAIAFTVGEGERQRRALAHYIYDFAKRRNALRFSSDGHSLAVYYSSEVHVPIWREVFSEIRLIISGIGWKRLAAVYRRWKAVKRLRAKEGAHLHCWFIGTHPLHRTGAGARELRDELFVEARKKQLPILIETTMEQNERVYQRIGFRTYAVFTHSGLTTYLMKLEFSLER